MSNIRLVDSVKKLSIAVKTKEGCPQIYKLPDIMTKQHPMRRLRKVTVGPEQNELKDEIKILIVGSTGSGKTTFINGVANYLYGVEWADNCRFKVNSDEIDQAISQNNDVTTYTFYWQPGFPIPYTVTLIDTPGFGNTRTIYYDLEIFDYLHSLFMNENGCGIDTLNAVAFVVPSSFSYVGCIQKYIFDSIMKIFGKDLADNFFIVATFADAGEPQVLSALKYDNIPTNYIGKFNNSALFAKNDGDNSTINQLFWDIGQESYKNMFASIAKMTPKSLTMTQNVLSERKKLHSSIDCLKKAINEGIEILEKIDKDHDQQYIKIYQKTFDLMIDCKRCVNRLQQIALRPITMSEIDIIEFEVLVEKQQLQPGWNRRIEWFNELLEEKKLLKIIKGEHF